MKCCIKPVGVCTERAGHDHISCLWGWKCEPCGLVWWCATEPGRTLRNLWGRGEGFPLLSTAQSCPLEEMPCWGHESLKNCLHLWELLKAPPAKGCGRYRKGGYVSLPALSLSVNSSSLPHLKNLCCKKARKQRPVLGDFLNPVIVPVCDSLAFISVSKGHRER